MAPKFDPELLKDCKLTVGDGVRIVSQEEMERLQKGTTSKSPETGLVTKEFMLDGAGHVTHANVWEQTSGKQLMNEKDPLTSGLLEWAVVSVVVPGANQTEQAKASRIAIKIRGAFRDADAASRHAEELMRRDPHFDIHVVKMYNWVCYPPDDDTRAEIEHKSIVKPLEDILEGYHTGQKEYRQKELQRIRQTREAAAKGEAGPMHEDYEGVKSEVTYQPASQVDKDNAVMDPSSDTPRLLD